MNMDASKFPPLSVTGIGLVDGLLGANCRHSIGPGDGVHNPFEHFDSKANREKEQLDQRQRELERRIRKTRREVMALQEGVNAAPDAAVRAEMEAAYRKKAAVLQRQEAEYDAFCKEHDLRKLYDRLQTARYGPRQAKAAEQAAEAETLKLEADRAIIKKRVADGEYSLTLSRQQYLKHVEGTTQFEHYFESRRAKGQSPQSIITISEEDAQDILQKYHGTGTPRVRRNGIVTNVEFVSVDHVVGKWCTPAGQWRPTSRAALHYAKRGSHVVPVEEKDG